MNLQELARTANFARYRKGQTQGLYESFFIRGNHPEKALAFWIRYTIFSPHKNPGKAIGELWFIFFDREAKKHTALKKEVPIAKCTFSNDSFSAEIDGSLLKRSQAGGFIEDRGNTVSWELAYSGNQEPLFDFPPSFYDRPLPKAKALVSLPFASFTGWINLNGRTIAIKNWIGSENHNWGSKHTAHYGLPS